MYKPRTFPSAQQCVRSLKEQGLRIVLVTGAIDFTIEPMAAYLEADALLAASLEEVNGVFTGRLLHPPLAGPEKAHRIQAWADREGVELASCLAFGDSAADLPLLKAVGYPRPVNPALRLGAIARGRGWPISRWREAP